MNNNCAFQYAKMTDGFGRSTNIVCDETSITMEQAKEMWNKYYPDAARHITDGGSVEMVIWKDMPDPDSYQTHEQYISTDAESDGVNIWVVEKKGFHTY